MYYYSVLVSNHQYVLRCGGALAVVLEEDGCRVFGLPVEQTGKPIVIISQWLADNLSDSQFMAILGHEICHLIYDIGGNATNDIEKEMRADAHGAAFSSASAMIGALKFITEDIRDIGRLEKAGFPIGKIKGSWEQYIATLDSLYAEQIAPRIEALATLE